MSAAAVPERPRGPHEPEAFSLEVAVDQIAALLKGRYPLSLRSIALLLLQEDKDIMTMVAEKDPATLGSIRQCIDHAKGHYSHPLDYVIASRRQEEAMALVSRIWHSGKEEGIPFNEYLSRCTIHPFWGIVILLLILYFGLYKLVGEFGAGTLVDLMETHLFEARLNPFFTLMTERWIPWEPLQSLLSGEYGVLTLGLRYSIAIILPIVGVFFTVFSVIEDTGYLPRLALLIDRLFKKIGLSGRAVIPMVLGFGCATMATMVTRTLPTRRERVIATLLLALAVPCSAQLGVILALLHGRTAAFLVWTSVMVGVFLFIGFLAARVLPGERPSFYMEVPPLRLPSLRNVVMKTLTRMWWYCLEVIPLFVLASLMIWAAQLAGIFAAAARLLAGPVQAMGLPPETAPVFIFGFFRRDYGAAGLYDLDKAGVLSGVQLVTACVALALFLPCIAQFLMNVRERGWKVGLAISVFVLIFSFSVAFILNVFLRVSGVVL